MKKLIIFIMAFVLLLNITGCEPLRKKFTRKQKESVKMPRIYQVKKYEKMPTPELYSKHYSFWVSWQSELIQKLGENHKKDTRCIEEILSNLKDMQNMLLPEKANQLTPHMQKLTKVKDIIFEEEITKANRAYPLMVLEREDRAIKRDFNSTKVRNYLKKSFEEEDETEKSK